MHLIDSIRLCLTDTKQLNLACFHLKHKIWLKKRIWFKNNSLKIMLFKNNFIEKMINFKKYSLYKEINVSWRSFAEKWILFLLQEPDGA